MRELNSALLEHLAQPTITLATCMAVSCTNGVVLRWTDHQAPLVVAGLTYQPGVAFNPHATESSDDLNEDNVEVECLLGDITDAQLQSGLFDDARIEAFLVDYTNPNGGALAQRNGTVGNVSFGINSGKFTLEVLGTAGKLNASIVEVYTQTCRASLGDGRCKVDRDALAKTGHVGGLVGNIALIDGLRDEPAGYFNYGTLTFTSGPNSGYTVEVRTYVPGTITLALAPKSQIAIGDTYVIKPGCDRQLSTCKGRFNNVINFRGEPYIPDPAKVFRPIIR